MSKKGTTQTPESGVDIRTPQPPTIPLPRVEHASLPEALCAAQSEFTVVPKSRTATVTGQNKKSGASYSYSYKYADLSDVLRMALPILTRHGIAVSQPIRRKNNAKGEEKLYLVTRLLFTRIAAGVAQETPLPHAMRELEVLEDDGLELSDADDPQELGIDQSYWRRYGFCGLVGISPEEDTDAVRDRSVSDERKPKQEHAQDPLRKTFEGKITQIGAGQSDTQEWMWFYIADGGDRFFSFNKAWSDAISDRRFVKIVAESTLGNNQKYFWKVIELTVVPQEGDEEAFTFPGDPPKQLGQVYPSSDGEATVVAVDGSHAAMRSANGSLASWHGQKCGDCAKLVNDIMNPPEKHKPLTPASTLPETKAGPVAVPKKNGRPGDDPEPAAFILNRIFPERGQLKTRRLVETNLEAINPGLHSAILLNFEKRVLKEKPSSQLGQIALLDIAKMEVLEEEAERRANNGND
jgi:hypothetical protein